VTVQAPGVQRLEQLWAELAQAGVGTGEFGRQRRRVIAGSRHDCFLAVSFPDRRRLLSIVTDGEVKKQRANRPLTSGIDLYYGMEPVSNHATIDLALRDTMQSDIFTALVADLLATLVESQSVDTTEKIVLVRLEEWRKLLSSIGTRGLTLEQQRGLFGELSILSDVLIPEIGSAAVLAWTGPDRQLQDFQFRDCAVEVKTAAGNKADIVRISNERQLDYRLAGDLFLVTIALDVRREGPGTTLPDLVEDLREKVRSVDMAADFGQRLTMSGYLDTQSELYAGQRYIVRQRVVHHIGPKFPKILECDLPSGVTDVSYTLDLNAAATFRTSESEMIRSLGLMS
jgi:Putative  PD-(D/E)XK family member, (DUF4420)